MRIEGDGILIFTEDEGCETCDCGHRRYEHFEREYDSDCLAKIGAESVPSNYARSSSHPWCVCHEFTRSFRSVLNDARQVKQDE